MNLTMLGQQQTLYGHTGYETALPPTLPGEELIPLELVLIIRDGRRTLETEDALVREILKELGVCGGPKIESGDWPVPAQYKRSGLPSSNLRLPTPLFWRYPATEPTVEDEWAVESGWELVFKSADGLPVRVSVVNVSYDMRDKFTNGMPRFVKEPPVVEMVVEQYNCPFSEAFSLRNEFRRRGFQACRIGRFANMAGLSSHMRDAHASESQDVEATYGLKRVEALIVADAERESAARREADPRLAPPEEPQRPDGD